MKILMPFRVLKWWRWLLTVNKLIGQYKKDTYRASKCPLCKTSRKAQCGDCLWKKFEGHSCLATPGLEREYELRVKRLHRWKCRMLYGKKVSEKMR